MVGAVNLDRDLAVVPGRVDPAPAALPVSASGLPAWLGEPERADDKAEEVELRDRLRAACDVAEASG